MAPERELFSDGRALAANGRMADIERDARSGPAAPALQDSECQTVASPRRFALGQDAKLRHRRLVGGRGGTEQRCPGAARYGGKLQAADLGGLERRLVEPGEGGARCAAFQRLLKRPQRLAMAFRVDQEHLAYIDARPGERRRVGHERRIDPGDPARFVAADTRQGGCQQPQFPDAVDIAQEFHQACGGPAAAV